MSTSLFETASRLKIRFSYKGLCTVESLWDIPLGDLDALFKALNAELKAESEESLLSTPTKSNRVLHLKVDIIKYICETRQEEKQLAQNQLIRKQQKQKVEELIVKKEESVLEDLTLDQLRDLANRL